MVKDRISAWFFPLYLSIGLIRVGALATSKDGHRWEFLKYHYELMAFCTSDCSYCGKFSDAQLVRGGAPAGFAAPAALAVGWWGLGLSEVPAVL